MMGRPSLTEQLAKAAEAGDLEKVKTLIEQIQKTKPKAKPKVKQKNKSSKRSPVKPVEEKQVVVVEEDVVERKPVNPTESFIMPTRRTDRHIIETDEDGNEAIKCRIVPFRIIKNRKNKFEDDMTEALGDLEFDKKVSKDRPKKQKNKGVLKKVKVKCMRCNGTFLLWPGEVLNENWSCDACLSGKNRQRD